MAILFTDLVGSTERLARLGDRRPAPGETGTGQWHTLPDDTRWLEGFFAWREGDVALGLSSMSRAVTGLLESGAWWAAAFILADVAEAVGHRAAARTEAARIFDQCGAGWRRDRALGVPAGVGTNLTARDG